MNNMLIALYLLIGSVNGFACLLYLMNSNNQTAMLWKDKSVLMKIISYGFDFIGWPISLPCLVFSVTHKV